MPAPPSLCGSFYIPRPLCQEKNPPPTSRNSLLPRAGPHDYSGETEKGVFDRSLSNGCGLRDRDLRDRAPTTQVKPKTRFWSGANAQTAGDLVKARGTTGYCLSALG